MRIGWNGTFSFLPRLILLALADQILIERKQLAILLMIPNHGSPAPHQAVMRVISLKFCHPDFGSVIDDRRARKSELKLSCLLQFSLVLPGSIQETLHIMIIEEGRQQHAGSFKEIKVAA